MTDSNKKFLSNYFGAMRALLDVEAVQDQLIEIADIFKECTLNNGQVFILGNGGSAGIASHIAIDLTKNGGVNARTISDAGEITCLANDYGFENWLQHALRLRMKKNDCVVLISSSGNSENMLNGAKFAREQGVKVITLTGMKPDNQLRQLGDINLWADNNSYNLVETIHQFWLMSIIDLLIGEMEYSAERVTVPLADRA